jgi:hypothetical protein
MVVINLKRSETDQFLFECTTGDSNDAVIRELCQICCLREKLSRLAGMLEELGKHGPSKPEAERGLDEIAEREGKRVEKGPHYCADPLGNRTGNAPAPALAEVLARTGADGLAACGLGRGGGSIALTTRGLQEKVDNVRGAVMMAFPMGLPAWDPVRLLLEDAAHAPDGYLAELAGREFLDASTASLWWAGKEFFRDQKVGDRVGKNEKTKVVARLQASASAGAPMREPAVSEEERKAMMAWYFKKQEEEKKLAEDDEDAFVGAKWAVRGGGALRTRKCPHPLTPEAPPVPHRRTPKRLRARCRGLQTLAGGLVGVGVVAAAAAESKKIVKISPLRSPTRSAIRGYSATSRVPSADTSFALKTGWWMVKRFASSPTHRRASAMAAASSMPGCHLASSAEYKK